MLKCTENCFVTVEKGKNMKCEHAPRMCDAQFDFTFATSFQFCLFVLLFMLLFFVIFVVVVSNYCLLICWLCVYLVTCDFLYVFKIDLFYKINNELFFFLFWLLFSIQMKINLLNGQPKVGLVSSNKIRFMIRPNTNFLSHKFILSIGYHLCFLFITFFFSL